MTTKDDLKAREANAKTAADLAAVARDAAALDADYAKAVLERAEMQCRMPADYLATAEASMAVGLDDYARDLYAQAEDLCFDTMEKAALGASLARTGLDPDKGRTLLEEAAGEAKQLNEFLTLSGFAKEALGDEALAVTLLAKVEERAKTLADYLNLAKTLAAEGNPDAARDFYKKAERHLDGMEDRVAYARGFIESFDDAAAARKVLEDAETDCQFPKDFAALAAGFRSVLNDGDKVAELMEQAAEFAMSGEENRDLAIAYWELMGDRDKSVDAFGKVLSDLNDKAQLLELGGFIASKVGAADLAKRFYAKAEQKMTSAGERLKLAEAVIKDTGDKAYAAEVYGRAAESLTQPNDLMAVAADVADRLGDTAQSAVIYRKAMAGMADLGQHLKLLEAVDAKLGDKAFAREILNKAGELASGTPAYLDLAKRAVAVLADQALARALLQTAEEQVTSVGEMKNVVAAVKAHFAEDAGWIAVVEEKRAKREANQAKYAVFQEREKSADSAVKTLKLADAVMAELDDRFYAQKLLIDAQSKLDEEGWDFSKARKLVEGVGRHLGDTEWATRLLKDAAARVQGFASLSLVADAAAELIPDREQANALVRDLLTGWEQRLAELPDKTPYDFSKLALVKGRLLGDTAAAAATLSQAVEEAERQGAGHFVYAELARAARELGLADQTAVLIDKAGSCCDSARTARQLANRLLEAGFGRDEVRALYAGLKSRINGTAERLDWADGIIDLFGDRTWAGQELAEIEASVQGEEARVVQGRRRRRVEHAL